MTKFSNSDSQQLPHFRVGYVLGAIFSTFLRCFLRLFLLSTLILMPLQVFLFSALHYATFDARDVFETIVCYIPILLLGTFNLFVSAIGMSLFVIPGLYISAMLSVLVPVIVIERIGFRALVRSVNLTQGYRWPIVGIVSVTGFIFLLVSIFFLSIDLLGTWYVAGQLPSYILILAYVWGILKNISMIAFFSVVAVTIYEQLRELKEGAVLESMPDIFD